MRPPTETNANFIAMFSGHFSDVSLALRDLYSKEFLFDSIFNESNHAWGIGLDSCLFTKTAKNMECVHFESEQDFSNENAEINNYKVFDTIFNFLNQANTNKNGKLYKDLNKKKIAFLFHLAQTDTIGHKDGSKSLRLINHLNHLDQYYQKLEKAFNDF